MGLPSGVARPLRFLAARFHSLAMYAENPVLLQVRRKGVTANHYMSLKKQWIKNLGFRTVLDVGANTGQFAVAVRAYLPEAQIYSFEPLPDCFQKLQSRFAGDRKFTAFNMGLGAESGIVAFERQDFTPASSFLKLTARYKDALPATQSSHASAVQVRVQSLDEIAKELDISGPLLVKIDVQGFEDKVVAGATETLRHASVVIIELSFVEMYHGQPLFRQVYEQMVQLGFDYHGNLEQMEQPNDERALQADCIFLRRGEETPASSVAN